MLRRFGAQPGDRLIVTGTIGDAALGLMLRREPHAGERWRLTQDQHDELNRRYLVPQPRTAIADLLGSYASSAMDVSDGLVGDLAKLCRVSRVGAVIETARLPLSQPARAALAGDPALIEPILTGGDDYEILASVPPGRVAALLEGARARGIAITEIGEVCTGEGELRVVDQAGQPLAFARPSFSHF
jgi:thiamine-monophosphate kinase